MPIMPELRYKGVNWTNIMNKSNALNGLGTIPTSTTGNSNFKIKVLIQNDKQIQCTLLHAPLYLELRCFGIEDEKKRKLLVQKIFGWIILQTVIYLLIMYLCLQYEQIIPDEDLDIFLDILISIDLISSAVFYYFRNFRRKVPYLSLVIVTILSGVLLGAYANYMNSLMILMEPTMLILQLLAIILFSLQNKLELTYLIASLIILLIFILMIMLNIFVFRANIAEMVTHTVFGSLAAVYVTFDVQLMMTSPLHRYGLTANEHVFGAVNVFADQAKLAWLVFRSFCLDGSILFYRTIKKTIISKFY